jgi:hypothetical protein
VRVAAPDPHRVRADHRLERSFAILRRGHLMLRSLGVRCGAAPYGFGQFLYAAGTSRSCLAHKPCGAVHNLRGPGVHQTSD